MTPAQMAAWADKQKDKAPDGDTAWHYHQIADHWRQISQRQEGRR